MKALVFDGQKKFELQERPDPKVQEGTDAVVRILKTTICGTDLHILRGNVATFKEGSILGHEGIGVVESCGPLVENFKPGDKVLVSCITSCGRCSMCRKQLWGQCLKGGWILGNEIDGCQAEQVRIPFADTSLHHIPEDIDSDALVFLSDIFPTGLEVGVQDGNLQPGQSLAVVGCGPVGLAALMTAKFYSPGRIYAIDNNPHRLEVAKELGATDLINNSEGTAVEQILEETDGVGVDVVIEAIGIPAGWDISQNLVRPGGNIAVLGVHGKPATINLQEMWRRNFTMTAGLVHTHTIPMLMEQIRIGNLKPELLQSHSFGLSEVKEAYEVFTNAAEHKSLKVMISNDYL